jgi:hypothetical protein
MTALQVVPPSATPNLAEQGSGESAEAVQALAQRNAGLLAELERVDGLDHVMRIHQQASALTALARAARVGLEQQNQLAATRVRVQHRAGTMLRELASEPRPGRAKRPRGKAPLRPQLPRGVLRQHGISGQESSIWQALASLDIDDVVRRMDELSANAQEITTSEFYRRGRAALRRRTSRLGASPAELRLRAALANLTRVRALTTVAERELGEKIARRLRGWGVLAPGRADLTTVVATCLCCGRERADRFARRCTCGGAWVSALR